MEFYPHNTDITLIGTAVSSSQALTGSFINNSSVISATVVNLAGLALNISGARGTDGTSYTSYGPTGPQGDRGVTGFRGNSIYLLSSSWSGSACAPPPASCYAYDFASVSETSGDYYCDFGSLTTYYSTDSTLSIGSPMYYNRICTSPMNGVNPVGAYTIGFSRVLKTNTGVNTLSQLAPCTFNI